MNRDRAFRWCQAFYYVDLGLIVFLATVSVLLMAGCSQRETPTGQQTAVSSSTATPAAITQPPYVPESMQPNVHPISPDEWAASDMDLDTMQPRRKETGMRTVDKSPALTNVHVADAATGWQLVPLEQAPASTITAMMSPLAPILDERVRSCIGYPLTAGFSKVRYNLLLQPNLYDVTIRNWSDPKWLATFRVADGTFPVNLWRIRGGVPTFWKQVRVQAGPGLPTGNPQTVLSADFFRGGDDLCVEAVRNIGPLLVAYDQQTGQVVQPQLSQIQSSSNDSTPIPGAWTTVVKR